MSTDEEVAANRANWDERVPSHVRAYGAESFAGDSGAISAVVRADAVSLAPHLPGGSVKGLRLIHLQSHIGTDSISWARLGADVVGVDFSRESVQAAHALAARAGVDCRFFECDVVDAARVVGERFDVVYTSIGVLNWLPDLPRWAEAVRDLLAPGGVFFLRDAHPMLNAVAFDSPVDALRLGRPYFGLEGPIRYEDGTTYADPGVRLRSAVTFEWPHSVSDIVQALLDVGLVLRAMDEGTTIPWQALGALVETPRGWVLPGAMDRLPLTLKIVATRPRTETR
ncbi:class I SAM-dependent methyltransferase [Naasia aerilata]|uniref:SAM-dependent methyltransferase n=1 Tax=Naasia aerilata TaxID=1162966 RepID=A0ABN6XLV9_9MICO|nr:class I SAM-dependent methyltransferase [Naasia aerilata]BDZ45964.1 SAM-dependent methyltransferase [Naasia aerilata]